MAAEHGEEGPSPMFDYTRTFLAVLVISSALPACSEAGAADDVLRSRIRARFDEAEAEGLSGAALVTIDGKRVVERGYGLSDREAGTSNDLDTAFDVGSVMKTLTAAAVYQLTSEGRLSPSSTLAEMLPGVPVDKASITLREIVQHRAGFQPHHDADGDFEPMTREEARELILSQALLFEPGSDEEYSNSGYTLLADIIQTVTNEPFTAYVHRALLARAGMTRTGFYSEELWQTVDTAKGYGADTFLDNDPATWPYTWALVGNGGLVSSALDLDRWLTAYDAGDVLSPEALEPFRTDYVEPGALTLGGEIAYGAAGAGDFGLGGVVLTIPARSFRLVVTSNAYDDVDIEALAKDVATLVAEHGGQP